MGVGVESFQFKTRKGQGGAKEGPKHVCEGKRALTLSPKVR